MTAQLATGGTPVRLETRFGAIAGLRSGDPSGTPVLLLPGYTGSKEDFAPLFIPLAQAGFAVTAIDLPGQFESSGPADPHEYCPDTLAKVVLAVAESLASPALGQGGTASDDIRPRRDLHSMPVHLLGHSFGGLVARAAVIAEPDRFASLVLLCSGPAAIGGERAELIVRLEPLLASAGIAAVYAASLAASRAQPGYVEPPPPLAAFLERRFVTGVPAMLQGMGQALRSEPDRVAELAAVAPPTLVIHGVDDDAWPPPVQRDMAARLGAELTIVPDAAHSPAVENPAATARALVEFWRRV